MALGVLIVIAKGRHSEFVAVAMRGGFAKAAVLSGKAVWATPQLLGQGVSVIVEMEREKAERVKADLVVFPNGTKVEPKKNWLVWEITDSVHERDKIVEAALQNLIGRKLLKPL